MLLKELDNKSLLRKCLECRLEKNISKFPTSGNLKCRQCYSRKYIFVDCSDCGKHYKIRKDNVITWSGRCKSCNARHVITKPEVIANRINKLKSLWKTDVFRNHMKENNPTLSGSRSPNWHGGVCTKNYLERRSEKYKQWRISVFERDNYTCQICLKHGVYLEANHIKLFSKYPNLRFDINNGITLCKGCHYSIRRKEEALEKKFFDIVWSKQ